MLNSHSPYANGYKAAVTRDNLSDVDRNLTEAINYLMMLTLPDGQPLYVSRRRTFILGFKMASRSLIEMSTNLFTEYESIHYVLAYKISQDHIETLFSKIRSKGGFDNNPDVLQFKSALRALLVKTDITPSLRANCLELDADSRVYELKPKAKTPQCTSESMDTPVNEATEKQEIPPVPDDVTDVIHYIGKISYALASISCHHCDAI